MRTFTPEAKDKFVHELSRMMVLRQCQTTARQQMLLEMEEADRRFDDGEIDSVKDLDEEICNCSDRYYWRMQLVVSMTTELAEGLLASRGNELNTILDEANAASRHMAMTVEHQMDHVVTVARSPTTIGDSRLAPESVDANQDIIENAIDLDSPTQNDTYMHVNKDTIQTDGHELTFHSKLNEQKRCRISGERVTTTLTPVCATSEPLASTTCNVGMQQENTNDKSSDMGIETSHIPSEIVLTGTGQTSPTTHVRVRMCSTTNYDVTCNRDNTAPTTVRTIVGNDADVSNTYRPIMVQHMVTKLNQQQADEFDYGTKQIDEALLQCDIENLCKHDHEMGQESRSCENDCKPFDPGPKTTRRLDFTESSIRNVDKFWLYKGDTHTSWVIPTRSSASQSVVTLPTTPVHDLEAHNIDSDGDDEMPNATTIYDIDDTHNDEDVRAANPFGTYTMSGRLQRRKTQRSGCMADFVSV